MPHCYTYCTVLEHKETEIQHGLFLVITMYCQASSPAVIKSNLCSIWTSLDLSSIFNFVVNANNNNLILNCLFWSQVAKTYRFWVKYRNVLQLKIKVEKSGFRKCNEIASKKVEKCDRKIATQVFTLFFKQLQ